MHSPARCYPPGPPGPPPPGPPGPPGPGPGPGPGLPPPGPVAMPSSAAAAAAAAAASRTNRLRRSLRSQQHPDSPASPASPASKHRDPARLQNKHGVSSPPVEFKTPTRPPRSKYICGFPGESPGTDGETHQDIVWDAASPSPVRPGKRGKRHLAAAGIGISEIVRRIAPMHGRPEVMEPTLQEWIGDNAAIPCTPEVQQHRGKKKPQRPSGVDDLLKLAKQFDFNMFQRDEEQAEDMHLQTLELLSEDILEYENTVQEGPQQPLVEPSPPDSPPAPKDSPPAPKGGPTAPVCSPQAPKGTPPAPEGGPLAPEGGPLAPEGGLVLQDHSMDDDLELLFDESTQRISGDLSLNGSLGPMEASVCNPAVARGPARCPILAGSLLDDDDWENDDFLNDSLVIEMTQNPLSFAPPQHCSTQRGSKGTQHGGSYLSRGPPSTPGGHGGMAQNEPRMPKNRLANPEFPLTHVVTGVARSQTSVLKTGPHAAFGALQCQALPSRDRPIISSFQPKRPWQLSGGAVAKPPAAQAPPPRTSHAKHDLAGPTPVTWNAMKENQPTRSSNILAPATAIDHFPADEDLDQLFSSEMVWDDDGDDDLLCQLCKDLDSQEVEPRKPAVLELRPPPSGAPGRGSQRPAPSAAASATKVGVYQKGHVEVNILTQASPAASGLHSLPDSSTGNAWSGVRVTRVESCGYGPPEQNRYGGIDAGRSQRYGGGAAPKPWAGDEGCFPFKKQPSPAVKAVHTGLEKCSMAEIERKKLQALERRRQRLQASQSLRAPT